jgi:transposase
MNVEIMQWDLVLLNLNRSVISKIISLYNQRRSLINVPKSGRPRKTTRITERKIGMLSRQNPFWDAVKIKNKIPNVSLLVSSIRRRLNEIGLYGRKPAKKPFISVKNRRARLQFAKEHLN